MRYTLLITLALASALYFSACNECKKVDCAGDNDNIQFKLVDANTGTNLIFGPGKTYESSDIEFYAVQGTDTTEYTWKAIPQTGTDSAISVDFFPRSATAYFKLSATETDTLHIDYSFKKTKCCGSETSISRFRYNNGSDISGPGVHSIAK